MGISREEEAYDAMLVEFADRAGRFLRHSAAAALPFDEFARLNDDQQAIMARLGDEIAATRAIQAGLSLTPDGAAAVLAPYDDGAAAAHVGLSGFLDSLGA